MLGQEHSRAQHAVVTDGSQHTSVSGLKRTQDPGRVTPEVGSAPLTVPF